MHGSKGQVVQMVTLCVTLQEGWKWQDLIKLMEAAEVRQEAAQEEQKQEEAGAGSKLSKQCSWEAQVCCPLSLFPLSLLSLASAASCGWSPQASLTASQ
jgi:hypothetical protein